MSFIGYLEGLVTDAELGADCLHIFTAYGTATGDLCRLMT